MKTYTTIAICVFTLLFVGCSEEHINRENPPNLRGLSIDEQALVQNSNTFAFDLFKAVNQMKGQENIFISPLSVDFALNMAINGAAGQTKEVMKQTLGIENLSDEEANAAVRDLTSLLLNMDKKTVLSIANSIWYKKGFTLENGFGQIIEKYYDGKIEGLNFDDPGAKDIINGWVENKTKGKIKDLIKSINGGDVMFLVNAIYFKGDWMYQFDKSQTKEDKFTLENGRQVPVQMMFSKGVKLKRYVNDTFQLLDIPYGNGQFNMAILLPASGKTTGDIMSMLTSQSLKSWIDQADTLTPQLLLPKFTMTFKTDLIAPLIDMGMQQPFTSAAEFPDFFEENTPLAIGRIIHQAFIEVNEEGSEAAAATAVSIIATSINMPMTIRVDHPFVFFIHEKHSAAILFAGKLMNPS